MKTKRLLMLMFASAALLFSSCGKDNEEIGNDSGSLAGTSWMAGERTYEWSTLQFTSASAVTYTEGLREEYVSFNGTYTYTAPNGTMHFDTDDGPMNGTFRVDGSSLYVRELDMTFAKQ